MMTGHPATAPEGVTGPGVAFTSARDQPVSEIAEILRSTISEADCFTQNIGGDTMTQTEQISVEVGDVVSITDALDRTYRGRVLGGTKPRYVALEPLEGEPVEIVVPRAHVTKIIMRPSVVRSGLATMVKGWNELNDDQQMFWRIEAEESIIETGHFEVSGRHNGSGVPQHIEGGV